MFASRCSAYVLVVLLAVTIGAQSTRSNWSIRNSGILTNYFSSALEVLGNAFKAQKILFSRFHENVLSVLAARATTIESIDERFTTFMVNAINNQTDPIVQKMLINMLEMYDTVYEAFSTYIPSWAGDSQRMIFATVSRSQEKSKSASGRIRSAFNRLTISAIQVLTFGGKDGRDCLGDITMELFEYLDVNTVSFMNCLINVVHGAEEDLKKIENMENEIDILADDVVSNVIFCTSVKYNLSKCLGPINNKIRTFSTQFTRQSALVNMELIEDSIDKCAEDSQTLSNSMVPYLTNRIKTCSK